jgi:hypothetical protein
VRTKAIGGPLHGQSVFLKGQKQTHEHDAVLYVTRMWEGADRRLVPVLVLADLDIGEAFSQAMQVMGGSVT